MVKLASRPSLRRCLIKARPRIPPTRLLFHARTSGSRKWRRPDRPARVPANRRARSRLIDLRRAVPRFRVLAAWCIACSNLGCRTAAIGPSLVRSRVVLAGICVTGMPAPGGGELMLSVYVPHGTSLERIEVAAGSHVPDNAIWFDLVGPTQQED